MLPDITSARGAPIPRYEVPDTPLLPEEAAALLQITEDELLAAACSGKVPGVRLGSVWRFPLSTVRRAAANQAA